MQPPGRGIRTLRLRYTMLLARDKFDSQGHCQEPEHQAKKVNSGKLYSDEKNLLENALKVRKDSRLVLS